MKIICDCGKEVELEFDEKPCSQECPSYFGFCSCHKKWVLTDFTQDYEEAVMNDVILPENGEYLNEEDDTWYYKDGTSMEQ